MENPWQDRGGTGRFAALLALAGALTALASLALAGAAGAPYLSGDGVNGWVVVFAAGLLACLVALPFGIELRLRDRYADHDKRWEVALVAWGAVGAALLVAAIVAGFDTGTLAGAAALITAIESGGVLATIVAWLLAGG